MEKEELKKNLEMVQTRIQSALGRVGRKPGEVKLVAVSKTKSVELIQLALELGQYDFGENYVQELRDKANQINHPEIHWHYIGSLQKNKVKYLVGRVVLIHSVDSLALVEEIEKRFSAGGEKILILLEVKLSEEETKSGVKPEGLVELAERALSKKAIELKGLMTMPPYFPDPESARPYYRKLREIKEDLEKKLNLGLPELSMGMSNDFEVAIEEGATIVRIGTIIFGEREQCKVSMAD